MVTTELCASLAPPAGDGTCESGLSQDTNADNQFFVAHLVSDCDGAVDDLVVGHAGCGDVHVVAGFRGGDRRAAHGRPGAEVDRVRVAAAAEAAGWHRVPDDDGDAARGAGGVGVVDGARDGERVADRALMRMLVRA